MAAIQNPARIPDFNVLLFGPTGVGKSTLGNVLTGRTSFEVAAGLDSVTREVSFADFELPKPDGSGDTWLVRVFDVLGFGDTALAPEEQVRLFESFADQAPNGIHAVLFTMRYGRMSGKVQAIIRLGFDLLGEGIKGIAHLVATHAEGDPVALEKDLRAYRVFKPFEDYFQGGVICYDSEAADAQQRLHAYLARAFQLGFGDGDGAQSVWTTASLETARAWRKTAHDRLAGLTADLQAHPRSMLALLLQGQASRAEVMTSIEEQEAVQRGRVELERQRWEAEQRRAAEERKRREEEAAAEAARLRQLEAERIRREQEIAAAEAQRRVDEEKEKQREAEIASILARYKALVEKAKQLKAEVDAADAEEHAALRKQQELMSKVIAACGRQPTGHYWDEFYELESKMFELRCDRRKNKLQLSECCAEREKCLSKMPSEGFRQLHRWFPADAGAS